MSFFNKTPKLYIDYIIDTDEDDWQVSRSSTTAKLSLARMKYEDTTDPKKQQEVRSKPWYVDIPFHFKGIVDNKVVDVGDPHKGRFFGKNPESAKDTFETYYTIIKKQEIEKLKKQQKEKKVKQVVEATQTAQAAVAEDPTSPELDVTQALSQGETNSTSTPTTPTASPETTIPRAANQNHSEEEKERQAQGAQQRLTSALYQQNPIRTATASTQSTNKASQQQKKTMRSYAPPSLQRFFTGTKKASKPKAANASASANATPASGGKRNNVTRKRSQNIIMKV